MLRRYGGVASRRQILALTDRAALDRAVWSRDVLRDARGRYSLPGVEEAVRVAGAMSGVLSHLSAAVHWGWAVKVPPTTPHVTLPRDRNVSAAQRRAVVPHWASLHADDLSDGLVTSRARTLQDCLTALPFDEALAVADSALRAGDVTEVGLCQLAALTRGPGAARARGVAAEADGRAANPFESVLRAIALGVRGLRLTPQLEISDHDFFARPDLVDPERRLVLEADSHTWHSSRQALLRDCRRYSGLTVRGWTVLRFAWEDVMLHPELVHEALIQAVWVTDQRAQLPLRRGRSA